MRKSPTKRALVTSVMSLLLCFTMLLGTTFAWFTDTASSTNNKIVAGTLDLKLLMHNGTEYVDIGENKDPIFGDGSIAQNNNAETKWEPGKTQVAYLAIENVGNLDLKYTVKLNLKDSTKDLYKVMQYAITPDATNENPADDWDAAKGITVVPGVQNAPAVEVVLEKGATHYFALSLHMLAEAGNEYQGGTITFDILVLATQLTSEEDSFGPDYDAESPMPGYSDAEYVAAPGGVFEDIPLETTDATAGATVPAELAQKLAEQGVSKVQLTAVAPSVKSENNAVTLNYGNVALLDQNGEEIDLSANTIPVPVKLEVGKDFAGKYATVFHNGAIVASGTVDAEGFLSYTTVHFCEVSVLLSDDAPAGDYVVDRKSVV